MNTVALIGRLTMNPELKSTTSGKCVTSFCIAVDRTYQAKGQDRQADFIDCVAWDKTAEFVSRYFIKGSLIAITGEIQTRNFEDKNGNKRKAVEVIARQVSFCESKKTDNNNDYDAIDDDDSLPWE